MARITLEDLERLGEEPAAADEDSSDNGDDPEGEGRLFAHWEAVAGTHRVSLPQGCHLGMTVPVLNEIHLTKEETELEREVLTAYYLPGAFQQNPPVPTDPEIHIIERAPLRVITR